MVRDLNRLPINFLPGWWKSVLNSGHIAGTIGVEILIDIASAQISLWLYYGGSLQTSTGQSAQFYSGLVWNLWNSNDYKGPFLSGGFQRGSRTFSFFRSADQLNGAFGATIGLGTGGSGGSLSATNFVQFPRTSTINLSSMAETVPLAALWAGITSVLVPGGGSTPAILTAASIGSFWPYSKWLTPNELSLRQGSKRPQAGASWV